MFDFNKFSNLNKNFITLCDDKEVLKTLSHQEVIHFSEIVEKTLVKIINDNDICVGLLMEHNVYIPSIIISLRKLHHAFVFLSSINFEQVVTYVKSLWILSFENIKELPTFKEVSRLTLDDKTLVVWNRNCSFPKRFNFQNIFCIVQTSGTTGENKLIRVTNTCIQANVMHLRQIFNINSEDIIFWGTNLTFDPSIIELMLALQSGASLLIVPARILINPTRLFDALFNVANVTLLQMVPSIFLRWNEEQIKQILLNSHMRILAFGGENFPKGILCLEKRSNFRLFNLYGISEVSCWAAFHEITDEGYTDEVPIGKSLEATIIEVRDEFGNVINQGKGEVFIGSSSRICYINEEVPEKISGTIFRKTGDIAEVKENGIFLVGRNNRIIKRFGHRINLTRLEKEIFEGTGLESVCIWSQGNGKLLTFILMKTLDLEIKGKIMDKLRIKFMNLLSKECFPDFIDIVSNFPLTSHGKINERALETLYSTSQITTSCEDIFRLLWCKYLGISFENLIELKGYTFFDIGGNSISALQLLTELRETITCEFPQELVSIIFEGNFEDCMYFLKKCKPLKNKHIIERPTDESSVKRKKICDNALKILWSYDLKACVDCSPLLFQKGDITYIAVGSFSQNFIIFQEDGQVVCEHTFPGSIEGTPTISPCKHFLLVGCFDGAMYCVDFGKKQIAWKFTTGGQIKSSACFCAKQSTAIFGSYDKTIYSVSITGGSKLWNTLLDGSISSNPLYEECTNSVFCATTKGLCFCLNGDDGRIIWRYNCSGPIFGTPCLTNSNENIIFPTVQGTLYCLQPVSGNLLWNYDANGFVFSSLVSHNNQILFNCDNNVVLLNISTSKCELVKTAAMESKMSTTPFITNINRNCVIVAACNSGRVNVIDFNTFEVISSIQLPGEVFSSPFVYNGRIYVGCRDNNFYCIELNK